jgi:hypothetical protein
MERVVYLLGAGFSAPLGLPVMSNFLEKSRDMFSKHPDRYQYFPNLFEQIKKFSFVKNYYNSDLFNIEEIFSIVEMASQLEGEALKDDFINYLSDVVEFYTPLIVPYGSELPSNWDRVIFSNNQIQNNYGLFVAALLNLRIKAKMIKSYQQKIRELQIERMNKSETVYAVITLNYDKVLENFSECRYPYLSSQKDQLIFASELNDEIKPFSNQTILAKLHGSVGLDNVVPPTWSKGVDQKIQPAWRMAYKALVEATQIRIIGYSLPEADAYVKYLLKAAIMKTPHLKRFDVLCMDDINGTVRQRYDKFVAFPGYLFQAKSVTDYLEFHSKSYEISRESGVEVLEANKLENAHVRFFKTE